MNEVLDGFLDWVASVDPVLRTTLAGILIMLETTVLLGLIVPGDTVVLVASAGVEAPVEYFSLVAVIITGSLTGASLGFLIGRHFGPWLRRSRLGRRIGEKNWERAEDFLDHRGGIAVFVSRFLPVLHSLTPLVVGMSHLRYRTFMLWLTPACIIWAFAYVSVGSAAAEGYRAAAGTLDGAAYYFVGAILGFWLLVYAVKRILDRYVSRITARRRELRAMEASEARGADGDNAKMGRGD
ncbi:membrane protein DedA with SNARE-associated domain [Microcella alkaliphila]|uniref:Membrane protein DedA with SNARE-associated domain n=1 Tax=Microcella alkaliphila TaxID=279828 RepID=A0A4Q7TNW2_9MICO|nr:DedA family protein [Microcella alkaliphila]RZT62516.1 membrane protein DedA with SNARE-associated domain [Microcella alkaliphila]